MNLVVLNCVADPSFFFRLCTTMTLRHRAVGGSYIPRSVETVPVYGFLEQLNQASLRPDPSHSFIKWVCLSLYLGAS